jgi:hypothetical protein
MTGAAPATALEQSRQEGEGIFRHGLYNGPVPCDEYQRLEQIYFAALRRFEPDSTRWFGGGKRVTQG